MTTGGGEGRGGEGGNNAVCYFLRCFIIMAFLELILYGDRKAESSSVSMGTGRWGLASLPVLLLPELLP